MVGLSVDVAKFSVGVRSEGYRTSTEPRSGLPLAQAVSESLAQGPADILILGNHGLVVGAATCDAADELVAEVERRLALEPRSAAPTDGGSLHLICAGSEYRLPKDPLCHTLGTDHHNFAIATK